MTQDVHSEVEQSLLHVSTAKLKLEKRLGNIQSELDAKDRTIAELQGTVEALEKQCMEQGARMRELEAENENLRD